MNWYQLTKIVALSLLYLAFSGFTVPDNDNKPIPKTKKTKKKIKKIKNNTDEEKVSKLGVYSGYSEDSYKKKSDYSSLYIPMKDSVKLALDVFLPKKLEADKKVPTIVYFVRYVRSFEPRGFFKMFGGQLFGHVKKKELEFFTSHGYACVVVDLRGSGASYGSRSMEFSPEEVADMSEVFDWIVDQEWSDGGLATTGVSYTGTTAELAVSSKHPGLKAAIPRFNMFDLYADICFPGGVRQAPFIDIWKKSTQALDNNDMGTFGGLAKSAIRGASRVEGDKKRRMVKAAIEEHKDNFDIFEGIFRINNRNDIDSVLNLAIDAYSIHHRLKEIEESGVPMYRITGWYDGGNLISAFKGLWNTSNTEKVLVGPWDHGPFEHISPFGKKGKKKNKAEFPVYLEMLRFFDFHMKGIENGIDKEPAVYYYQMGAEEFRGTDKWPLEESKMEGFYFSKDSKLMDKSEVEAGEIVYDCDYTVGTGNQGRWNSLTPLYRGGPIGYENRAEMNEKMVLFTGEALTEDVEITGYPIADIYLSIDSDDTYLFVYLEDLAPDGTVTYITEGEFRAIHRKVSENRPPYKNFGPYHSFEKEDVQPMVPNEVAQLSFNMLPTSYLMQKGHSIRVSVAAADTDHFDLLPNKPEKMTIYYSDKYPSKVQIPIVEKQK